MFHLPPRPNRAPGQLINPAKIYNEQREKEEKEIMEEKERQRKKRH